MLVVVHNPFRKSYENIHTLKYLYIEKKILKTNRVYSALR